MKDTLFLRRRIGAAIATFPIGAAALLGASCQDDVQYAAETEVDEDNNDTSNNDSVNNDVANNDVDNNDANNDVVNNDVTNNDVNNPVNNPPPPLSCEEVRESSGDFIQEGMDDGCGNPWGTWEMSLEEAVALTQPPCNDGVSIDTEGCPVEIYLDYVDGADWEDYRSQPLYLSLEVGSDEECIYRWSVAWGCEGRALHDEADHGVVARLRRGASWSAPIRLGQALEELPEELRKLIGLGFLQDARHEHASIASFSRASLELMHHAAPPALLAAAQQAAIDEVEHAQACFALASAYMGEPVEPGPLTSPAPRYGSLVELAVSTFEEGAVGESIATLANLRALEGCVVEDTREALAAIVDEEAQHAALAWATLRWALQAGGAEVADALREAAEALRPQEQEVPAIAADTARLLSRHGRLTPRQMHASEVDAWRGVITPTLEALLDEA